MSASQSESVDDSSVIETLRTVTPGVGTRENTEMNAFGWGMFLALVILLVPLLPFLVIVWAISKVLERF